MPNPTPPPVPVDEGDERKARDYRALLKILLDERDLGSAVVALADFVAAVRSERDAELPGWKDRPDALGLWVCLLRAGGTFVVMCEHSFDVHVGPGDRWFGPVVITPDGGRAK